MCFRCLNWQTLHNLRFKQGAGLDVTFATEKVDAVVLRGDRHFRVPDPTAKPKNGCPIHPIKSPIKNNIRNANQDYFTRVPGRSKSTTIPILGNPNFTKLVTSALLASATEILGQQGKNVLALNCSPFWHTSWG